MILTAKEKAHELLYKFMAKRISWKQSKLCALVAVDEILQIFNNEWTKLDFWTEEINGTINFWQEVKQEIEKL